MTSVVPKGQLNLAIADAKEASVWIEEVKKDVANEEVSQGEEAVYEKTPSKFDRSEPDFGELPLFNTPELWKGQLDNGMKVIGIENNEVPLVQFDITIPGGQFMEPLDKSGVSSLLSDLLMQGTKTKTPADLEEAIGLLGASIGMYTTNEDFHITGSCLTKNFKETMALVKEIILEPRWDEKEYSRLKLALETSIKGREANPSFIAASNFNTLLYGTNHPFGIPSSGTLETTGRISMEDLKTYYTQLSPDNAYFHVAGAIGKSQTLDAISVLNDWKKPVKDIQSFKVPEQDKANTLYFIDVPDAKQSVLYIGKLALSETNEDANKLGFANEIIGGGSSGQLFQTLRIGKGYTYGAYSSIGTTREVAPFTVRTSVRANATLKSLEIIKDMLSNYAENFSDTEVELTKNKVLKSQTRAYESLGAKIGMLQEITKYNKPDDFLVKKQNELVNMNLSDYKNVINKYLNEKDMIYVVVGDKATQFEDIKKLGKNVIELDIFGNKK